MYLVNVERRNLKSSPLSNRKENARRDLYKTHLFFLYRQHDYMSPDFPTAVLHFQILCFLLLGKIKILCREESSYQLSYLTSNY